MNTIHEYSGSLEEWEKSEKNCLLFLAETVELLIDYNMVSSFISKVFDKTKKKEIKS